MLTFKKLLSLPRQMATLACLSQPYGLSYAQDLAAHPLISFLVRVCSLKHIMAPKKGHVSHKYKVQQYHASKAAAASSAVSTASSAVSKGLTAEELQAQHSGAYFYDW